MNVRADAMSQEEAAIRVDLAAGDGWLPSTAGTTLSSPTFPLASRDPSIISSSTPMA